ncbi:MAG: XrtA/PEP-CTERM system-associated ATPase [Sphingomonadaceae bacterium]
MYNDHYGLTGRPFQLTPDPRFYFDSATHRKAMAYLGYGLAQGEGFIVVTGEIGAGKTTLVGHLMANIDPARVNAVKIVSTQIEGDDMLRLVAASFGLATENVEKGQLLDRIEKFIIDRARTGQRTLLIVDEAQNLPISSLEELRMLSNFQAKEQSMLQIFLLGQPEFRDRLNDSAQLEQLRQRVIATHHLTSMEPNEVGPYIEHRMKLVGWQGNPHFEPAAYQMIFEKTGGVPRKINNLMSRILLMGAIEKSPVIDPRLIAAVIADLGKETAEAKDITPATPPASGSAMAELSARVAMLEAQSEEQGLALRRVLSLLVDWVEQDDINRAGPEILRAPAR